MAIKIEPLTADRLGDLQELILPFWRRQWERPFADRMFHWRFLERPQWEASLAYDDGKPVAFLDSFIRQRVVGSELRQVRETADWYSAPAYRPLLGIRLMRKLMEAEQPMLVVGGNENTQSLLPKLGWRQLAPLERYVRPLRLGAAVKEASRKLHFPLSAIPAAVAGVFSLRIGAVRESARPAGHLSVSELKDTDTLPDIRPSDANSQLCAFLTNDEAKWLRSAPQEMGEFVLLAFLIDGVPSAITLSRLHREKPFTTASLLHLQSATDRSELYDWVVAETVRRLSERGAHWVTARFNAQAVQKSCESAGFRRMNSCVKSFWWDRNDTHDPDDPHLSWVCGDEGLHPLPD